MLAYFQQKPSSWFVASIDVFPETLQHLQQGYY